ncbi:class F sortase [Amycolatopsis sp. PS_44_ISF1]|uniref:class F sortase n=1 Tax=Amycolatopsis sp. PS_44_ISF1 TaxID=2974917 RepID=UPI0028DF77DF|nr:class F sortase [Amycolatopsis sp. PS_44_ISF1]MDT8914638.1 class F sortase [Amycolatopsis sp. PS_44_ISF1]
MLRRALILLFSGLAVLGLAAGVVVLTWAPAPAPVAAAEPPPGSLPGEDGAPAVLPADSSAVGQQRPGTVRLPGGAESRLVRTEVTRDGVLPIPRGLVDAAWWGARLGAEQGAAVLSGHVNWGGAKGPFDELWRIRTGDDVSIVDAAGGRWLYRVTGAMTVAKGELPAQAPRWFAQSGPHRLVLVTCGGDYVGGREGYDENRIVTANLVSRPD